MIARGAATALLGLLCGCASYGWADRADASAGDHRVAVRTLDVDADAGVNASVLTQDFVLELRRAGLGAEWTGAQRSSAVVECRVAIIGDAAFGAHSAVEVETSCELDGAHAARQKADAQVALDAIGQSAGRRRATEAAARASFTAVARELRDFLNEGP